MQERLKTKKMKLLEEVESFLREREQKLREKFYISSLRREEDISSSLDACQEKIDEISWIEGYDTIPLSLNENGFVVDENGNYLVKEVFFHLERMEKKVSHLFVNEQMFKHKENDYRNKWIRYRSRYRES